MDRIEWQLDPNRPRPDHGAVVMRMTVDTEAPGPVIEAEAQHGVAVE